MRRFHDEDGASIVEFAILLPVLVLIVMGTVQFGLAYTRIQSLEAAAREGARLAAVGAAYDDIQERVQSSQTTFATRDVVVDTQPNTDPPCQRVGDVVDVTVRVKPSDDYLISIPLMGEFEVTYKANGRFTCERHGT